MIKNYRICLILLFAVSATFNQARAQQNVKLSELMLDGRTGLPRYAEVLPESGLTEDAFFSWLNSTYKLPEGTTFYLWRSDVDEFGFTHNRYQQFYHGIEVLHSMIIVHIKNGLVESFNGEYFKSFSEISPATSPIAARETVIASFGKNIVFRWDVPEREAEIKMIKNDPEATWYPKTIREYYAYPEGYDGKTPLIHCYSVEIALENPRLHEQVLVNVANGAMFRTIPLEIHSDSAGSANTHYEGVKKITTDFMMKDSFRLREKTGRNIETRKASSTGADFFDADNYWNNGTDKIAGDIHYAAELVNDFMYIFFKRKSYDSKGGVILSVAASGSGNAFWNLGGNYATFLVGSSSTVGPCASLDVVGHEFGHGIADENAGLQYSGEACALHESFADITGHMTEFVNDSATANWDLGEKVWPASKGIRYMRNPHKFSDPKAYGGQYFPKGCHGSGGVQNYWFYLMVNGDTAKNEFNYSYSLNGLGHWKAAQITYRSYFYYIIPGSTFKDAMKGAIKAAKDIYGSCSPELDYTYKAWKAVNVEDTSVKTIDLSHGINAPGLLCSGVPVSATLSCFGDVSRTVSWEVNNVDTSTRKTWSYQFNNTGSYLVKLYTNTCGKMFEDSMYITVNHTPKPAFTRPFDSACASNTSYKFTNTTVNADSKIPLLYYWYINPGSTIDTAKHLFAKFPIAADYEVSLKAYYQGGCWTVTKQMVTILDAPTANFTVLKDVCENREIRLRNLTDTVYTKPTFKWLFPDNTSSTVYEPAKKSLPTAGVYPIILEVHFPYGNCMDTAMRNVKIMANPKPDFTWKNNCKNSDMKVMAGGSSIAGKAWSQWHLGSFNPINKDTFVFSSGDSFSRTLGYSMGDTLGCFATIYKTVNLGTLDLTLNIDPVCFGDSTKMKYTVATSAPVSLQWDLGNGVNKSGELPSYKYSSSGNYPVQFKGTTASCERTIKKTAIVKATPVMSFNTENVCDGDTVFYNNTSAGKDSTNYTWNYGDNNTGTGYHSSHLYATGITRTFNVTLGGTYTNGCGSSLVKTATVFENPVCTFNAAFDATAGNNGFNFTPALPGLKRYHWDFGDGDTSNQNSPFHRYKDNGIYTATLTAWSDAGCSCESTFEVDAHFSSVINLTREDIDVYPIPTKEHLNIAIPLNFKGNYEIFDITGTRVREGELSGGINTIVLSAMTGSVYIVRITAGGQQFTETIVVSK